MDFPLDPIQLAALERQRTASRSSRRIDAEVDLVLEAPAGRKGRWPARAAWIGGALAILAIPAYFYSTRPSHQAARTPGQSTPAASTPQNALGLTVDRRGTDLLLSWDRHSPSVTSATFGVVLIRESDRTRNVALTPEQLRFGSVRYKPASDEVDIELNVAAGDHLVKETVIAVLP
jgi:hypothetical protein